MAELSFIYGTMESGKTTKLLQDNYNYRRHGHKVIIIKPLIDTKGGNTVVTRTNEQANVDILLAKDESILDKKYLRQIIDAKVLLVDEAQFCSFEQIKDFWSIAHILNIGVICYGLKNDFRGIPFEGTTALIGFADHKTELTVHCECGEIAVFNARCIDGEFTDTGDVVAIDGEHHVSYVPLCSDCYLKHVIDKDYTKRVLKLKNTCKKS